MIVPAQKKIDNDGRKERRKEQEKETSMQQGQNMLENFWYVINMFVRKIIS